MGDANTRDLYLGATLDASGARAVALRYPADELTTHGVIVGMTGSGKTGLGVVLLEELLRAGIPALIIDPKGDMGNLALSFPDLQATDFEPWIDEADQTRRRQAADERARQWRDGLAGWQLGGDDIARLRAAADVTIYTPGSHAGVPLNVLGSFAAPTIDWQAGAENARAEIEGLVSGLLQLIDIDSDPLSSREHILLANLVEHAWRDGRDLDLAQLIQHIMTPPLRKLGVFDLDSFFPVDDRRALAMRLNGLLATPSFAAWLDGEAVAIDKLLWRSDGAPRAAVVYLAHLSERERQFVVTLLMSKMATWMQTQPGSARLRAAVYMDEVFGFLPPTAAPPSKKPILTLLKQARAFGVGVILATQNPVDVDYKAMANAGTWMIGRLQTERDKARILTALQSATGDSDSKALARQLGDLEKRQFLLYSTGGDAPALFTSRWALSYLAGPLTRAQLTSLRPEPIIAASPPATEPPPRAAAPAPADAASPVAPPIAAGVPVFFMDPAAPWAAKVGARASATNLSAAIAARVRLTFDERKAELDHDQEWEAIFTELTDPFDASAGIAVDYDRRDFNTTPPAAVSYRECVAPLTSKSYFKSVAKLVRDWLHQHQEIELLHNPELKLYSFVGESREDFASRCQRAGDEGADAQTAKLRDELTRKLRTLQRKLDQAERRQHDSEQQAGDSKRDEVIGGVGSVLGVLLGRRSARSIARGTTSSARRAASARSRSARLARKAREYGDKADDIAEEIADLEEDTTADIADIVDEWEARAGAIETTRIGLERNDITVEEIALLWLPVGV